MFFLFKEPEKEVTICEECPEYEEDALAEEKEEVSKIAVDIKGYVKNPGVYELEEGAMIHDVIVLAGGLKNNGTTDNINLSRKLKNEDCIRILSKTELKKLSTPITSSTENLSGSNTADATEIATIPYINDSCVLASDSTSTTTSKTDDTSTSNVNEKEPANTESNVTNKKVSINLASKEELMTISGIGESKAEKIIEYRNKTPFKDISEIMNVSGIGESLYEKIKDSITI